MDEGVLWMIVIEVILTLIIGSWKNILDVDFMISTTGSVNSSENWILSLIFGTKKSLKRKHLDPL